MSLALLEGEGDYAEGFPHSERFTAQEPELPNGYGQRLVSDSAASGYVASAALFDAQFESPPVRRPRRSSASSRRARWRATFPRVEVRFAIVPKGTCSPAYGEWGALPAITRGLELNRWRGSHWIYSGGQQRIEVMTFHMPLGYELAVDVVNGSAYTLINPIAQVEFRYTRADFERGLRVRPCEHVLPTGVVCGQDASDALDPYEPDTFRCAAHCDRKADRFRFGFRDYRGRFFQERGE